MTRYPTLEHFFGAYMNEDWPDDYGNEWTAVDGFIADGPPEDPELFRAEIAQLLAEYPSEEDVRKIVLDDLESCFLADVAGWKYRDWLQALADHAAKAAGHPRAS